MLTSTRALLVVSVGLFICLIGGCAADGGQAKSKADAQKASALLAEAEASFIQGQLATGNAALEAGDKVAAEQAAHAVHAVLAIKPNDVAGKALLRRAELSYGSSGVEKPVLDRYVDNMSLRRQAALAEYYDLMDRSRRLLKAGNYDAAHHAVLGAMIVLDRNRDYLLPEDRQGGTHEAKEQGRVIEERRLKLDQTRDESTKADERRQRDDRCAEVIGRSRDEANRLLARADALRQAQRYQEAVDLLRQVTWLDPGNTAAPAMREAVEDAMVLTSANRGYRYRSLHTGAQAAANLDATSPGGGVVNYSGDWPALTASRYAD